MKCNLWVAVYLAVQYQNGGVPSKLGVAKTKVAPLPIVSIPRLKLMAATLSLHLVKYSSKSLQDYSWLRHWISNPGVLCSKPLGGSKVDSAFHPSEVDKMSTRNIWELSGKNKLPP